LDQVIRPEPTLFFEINCFVIYLFLTNAHNKKSQHVSNVAH
jgi:hypothetical protein